MTMFSLLHLRGVPILQQLQIEEALLRADERNWCIINSNVAPAIVMGLSAKPEEMIHLDLAQRDKIPLIKRFSGGGTVVVDENTLFMTFICQTEGLQVDPTPHAIMRWSENFYAPLFAHPRFQLRENDYVLGDHKFGGNAQYIRKGRWLHHTSFLWDYHPSKMEYLRMPKKRPCYRAERAHSNFLCTLKEHYPSKESLLERFEKRLGEVFQVKKYRMEDVEPLLSSSHRKSTHQISF